MSVIIGSSDVGRGKVAQGRVAGDDQHADMMPVNGAPIKPAVLTANW
jgi:hypothetical protein